jgi:hypothetical protein
MGTRDAFPSTSRGLNEDQTQRRPRQFCRSGRRVNILRFRSTLTAQTRALLGYISLRHILSCHPPVSERKWWIEHGLCIIKKVQNISAIRHCHTNRSRCRPSRYHPILSLSWLWGLVMRLVRWQSVCWQRREWEVGVFSVTKEIDGLKPYFPCLEDTGD